jgi:hypothetical protein
MSISTTLVVVSLSLELLTLGSAWRQRAAFEDPYKDMVANIRIRALSSSIHAGTANQDTYLGEIVSKSGDRRLANLIDVYAAEASGIDRNALKSLPTFRMKISRSPYCDVAANRFFLSGMSILFDDAVRTDLAQDASRILPCYRIVHGSVRITNTDHSKLR